MLSAAALRRRLHELHWSYTRRNEKTLKTATFKEKDTQNGVFYEHLLLDS